MIVRQKRSNKFLIILSVLISGLIVSPVAAQHLLTERDLTVLVSPADTMMRNYLTSIVDEQFRIRDSILSSLKTAADWDRRAQVIRDSIISWTGPLPERTPLNARVTGILKRDGYVVEKILFESRPGYFVSANLYLPEKFSSPCPAQLNLIGHAQLGKADERYQRMSISQVKRGFIVLTMDQMGQGERGLLSSHQIIGTQAFLCGTHVFNLMVWDAIRAIDYLTERPEVDKNKISITGSSGGGMMTTYILPFENRLAVAVPTCNPNTWSYRVHANLSCDHEQVFFGAFAGTIDPRGDPLFVQTPKPLLLNTTTDDNLNPPRGVWKLGSWLFKSYSAHGVPEKFTTTMVRAPHAYNQEQREITYSWISRWTGGNSENYHEQEAIIETAEDLWAATGGNIFNETGSRRPQELVADYLDQNRAAWPIVRKQNGIKNHKTEMAAHVKKILHTDLNVISVQSELKNESNSGNISVRKFIIEPEKGIILPGVVLSDVNSVPAKGTVLYINEKGKSGLLPDQVLATEILRSGYNICAIDIRGTGETSPDMSNKFWDFLSGKPIFGQRVKDILSVIKWIENDLKESNIIYWGTGMGSVYGAFAGVLSDNVSGFILEEPLISFESIVNSEKPGYDHEILLPGILENFDMQQVYQAICPKPVFVLNPLSGDKKNAGSSEIEKIDENVKTTYKSIRIQKDWMIKSLSGSERSDLILRFIQDI